MVLWKRRGSARTLLGKEDPSSVSIADTLVNSIEWMVTTGFLGSACAEECSALREGRVRKGNERNTKMSLTGGSTGCVTLGKLLHLPEPHFSNL